MSYNEKWEYRIFMTNGSGGAGGGSPTSGDAGPGGSGGRAGGVNCLPEYNGSRRQGAYKEWQRTVQAYALAFDVPAKQLAPRVWLRLRGEAWDDVDHLDIAELNDEDGMRKIWNILDAEFSQDIVDRMEETVEGFWNFRRPFRMDMETYISTMAFAAA